MVNLTPHAVCPSVCLFFCESVIETEGSERGYAEFANQPPQVRSAKGAHASVGLWCEGCAEKFCAFSHFNSLHLAYYARPVTHKRVHTHHRKCVHTQLEKAMAQCCCCFCFEPFLLFLLALFVCFPKYFRFMKNLFSCNSAAAAATTTMAKLCNDLKQNAIIARSTLSLLKHTQTHMHRCTATAALLVAAHYKIGQFVGH